MLLGGSEAQAAFTSWTSGFGRWRRGRKKHLGPGRGRLKGAGEDWGSHLQSLLSRSRGLQGRATKPNPQSLERFSLPSRFPRWADPSSATTISFSPEFSHYPPKPGSKGPGLPRTGARLYLAPLPHRTHIPRLSRAGPSWGRPRSRADRVALTLTSRSCGRRPILGLAPSRSWLPGSFGHPRGAGRRWRTPAAPGGRRALLWMPGARVPGFALPRPARRAVLSLLGQVWPPFPDPAWPIARPGARLVPPPPPLSARS
jgi:hypothetical protein